MDHHTQVLKITLPPEEILAMKLLLCHVDGCAEHFTNASHLQLHLTRRHKLTVTGNPAFEENVGILRHFHCPEESCLYHLRASGEKYFSSFRSLKQHFLKMHSEKVWLGMNFICDRCDGQKSFATESLLRAHQTSCGQVFCCKSCGLTYGSREGLLSHARRKNHNYDEVLAEKPNKRKAVPQQDLPELSKIARQCTIYVQTDRTHNPKEAYKHSRTTQTIATQPEVAPVVLDALPLSIDNPLPSTSNGSTNLELPPPPPPPPTETVSDSVTCVCTETQTDLIYDTMFPNEDRTDPMLYSHMYTQTCDDIISDLGLATIETQTNWDGLGEFLVSTETQTPTSMEFLNAISGESSSIHTQTS